MNDLLSRLIAAGTPADLIAEVAMLGARAAAAAEAIEQRRSSDRVRTARRRNAMSRDVTGDNGTARDVTDEPSPAPSPLLSPQTPQTTPHPHPHPEGSTAYACEALRLAMAVLEAGCRALIDAQAAPKRRWPKDMPPPPGVTAEQWAGFVEHRKAKRAPLTPRAYQLLCTKLASIADDDWPPGRLVDLIVERNWLSIEREWLPSTTETRNGKRPHHDRPSGPIESSRRFREQLELDAQRGDGTGDGA